MISCSYSATPTSSKHPNFTVTPFPNIENECIKPPLTHLNQRPSLPSNPNTHRSPSQMPPKPLFHLPAIRHAYVPHHSTIPNTHPNSPSMRLHFPSPSQSTCIRSCMLLVNHLPYQTLMSRIDTWVSLLECDETGACVRIGERW
jgi:hypothetical protein